VVASKLLTRREQSLYEGLLSLYPNHKVFVQVALSQLIDVPEDQPERQSIRNRFSQLVADFVLCRPDLTVVAVIELDDRSHERRVRQDADARKTKALVDAGLRLVRIPAGNLPSKEELREIIDADRVPSGDRSENPKMHSFIAAEPELRLAGDWGGTHTGAPRVNHERAAMRALKVGALKMVLAGIVIVGRNWRRSGVLSCERRRTFSGRRITLGWPITPLRRHVNTRLIGTRRWSVAISICGRRGTSRSSGWRTIRPVSPVERRLCWITDRLVGRGSERL